MRIAILALFAALIGPDGNSLEDQRRSHPHGASVHFKTKAPGAHTGRLAFGGAPAAGRLLPRRGSWAVAYGIERETGSLQMLRK